MEITKEKLEELLARNFGLKRLAKHLNTSVHYIKLLLSRYGLKTNHKYFDSTNKGAKCTECGKYNAVRLDICQRCVHACKRYARKKALVVYKGSQCEQCGLKTDDVSIYDFHHKENTDKQFDLAAALRKHTSWIKLIDEVDKCRLICTYCHRKQHTRYFKTDTAKKMIDSWVSELLTNKDSSDACDD